MQAHSEAPWTGLENSREMLGWKLRELKEVRCNPPQYKYKCATCAVDLDVWGRHRGRGTTETNFGATKSSQKECNTADQLHVSMLSMTHWAPALPLLQFVALQACRYAMCIARQTRSFLFVRDLHPPLFKPENRIMQWNDALINLCGTRLPPAPNSNGTI